MTTPDTDLVMHCDPSTAIKVSSLSNWQAYKPAKQLKLFQPPSFSQQTSKAAGTMDRPSNARATSASNCPLWKAIMK